MRRLALLCATSAILLACGRDENPGAVDPDGPYAAEFERYWSMCVDEDPDAAQWLEAHDPGVFEIIDLWHGDARVGAPAPFMVTVGRLHPAPLPAASLTVRAYPIDADGLELIPQPVADHHPDDSPIPPWLRNDPAVRMFEDIERGAFGVEMDMGEHRFDEVGDIIDTTLIGCEAALLRGQLVAHDPGTYPIRIELLFDDEDGHTLLFGDVVDVVVR